MMMIGKNSSSKCQKKKAFSSEEKYILLVNEYREKEVHCSLQKKYCCMLLSLRLKAIQ
jgi:hypothetical protein